MSECKEFQYIIGTWAEKEFSPYMPEGNGIVAHFIKEVHEFVTSQSPEEAADCFLLLMQHAHTHGYDLFEEAQKKHKINLGRKWGDPDENGCIEHIRE